MSDYQKHKPIQNTTVDKTSRRAAEVLDEILKDADNAKGTRHNTGKPRPSMVPPSFYIEMIKVMEAGAKKYSARNWQKGLEFSSVLDSLERHLIDFKNGVDYDKETGCHQMAHIAINAMFVFWYQSQEMKKLDDRKEVYK